MHLTPAVLTRRFALLATLALALLLCSDASAKTLAKFKGDANVEHRKDAKFKLTGKENKVTLTVNFTAYRNGYLRIYFHNRSAQGGWAPMHNHKAFFRKSAKKSVSFTLPKDTYKITISCRRGEYDVQLDG